MSAGRLSGKKAFISGASRGIGRAIAERFAEEGADLFLTARGLPQLQEVKKAVETFGAEVHLGRGDMGDRDDVLRLFSEAIKAFPDLNVLVNNAGVYCGSSFIDYTAEQFDEVMKVNTYGVFYMMQEAGRHFVNQGGGQIVNIASTAGKWESPNQAAYNASKHAVVALTRCAALELAPKGININAVCPGFVETDMVGEFEVHAEAQGIDFEKFKDAMRSRVPIGRFLKPLEIADITVYLASEEARGMTGQTITISGGMRMG